YDNRVSKRGWVHRSATSGAPMAGSWASTDGASTWGVRGQLAAAAMVEHGSGRDMARRRGNRAQTAHGAVAAAMPDDPISVSIVGSDSAARWLFLAQGLGDLL